jgi:subtilisin family serine protease
MFVWIKRGFLSLAILGLLLTGAAQAQNGRGQGNGVAAPDGVIQLRPTGPVPGQYVVVFDDDVTDPRGLANALARRNGFAPRHVYEFALKGFAAAMSATMAQALAQHPDVAYVEQDVYAHAVAQTLGTGILRTEADLNVIANIDDVDGAFGVERVDVDIAVLDTGVDYDNPDLNVFRRADCAKGGPFTLRCRDGEGDDVYGHGTHVAGIAAALDNVIGVVGMAPGARIWSIKVLGDNGSGYFSWSVAALDYVTQHADEIEVANMSLGGQGQMASLRTAIQNAVNAGVVVVVAAGNELDDVYGADGTFNTGDDRMPAAYPEAMTVSAMADFDGLPGGQDPQGLNFNACSHYGDDVFACFTNFSHSVIGSNPVNSPGAAIDVAGPGMSILSTLPGGSTYEAWSGTSMAAPHVAGAVALCIVEDCALLGGPPTNAAGVYAIRQALIDAAEPQEDWRDDDGAGPSLATGDPDGNHEGLVNALGGGGLGGGIPVTSSPSVSWYSPSGGTVSGSIAIQIEATDGEDAAGSLNVEWRVKGSGDPWALATYNGTAYYEASSDWDTTMVSDGNVTLEARATDSDSNVTPVEITVTVDNVPDPEPAGVVAADIDYATEGGRNQDKHLRITVTAKDNGGNPVVGASVSVDLYRDDVLDAAGTGTTGTDGTVTFSRKGAPTGCYTTDVTADGVALDPSVVLDGDFDDGLCK